VSNDSIKTKLVIDTTRGLIRSSIPPPKLIDKPPKELLSTNSTLDRDQYTELTRNNNKLESMDLDSPTNEH